MDKEPNMRLSEERRLAQVFPYVVEGWICKCPLSISSVAGTGLGLEIQKWINLRPCPGGALGLWRGWVMGERECRERGRPQSKTAVTVWWVSCAANGEREHSGGCSTKADGGGGNQRRLPGEGGI